MLNMDVGSKQVLSLVNRQLYEGIDGFNPRAFLKGGGKES